MSPKQGAHVPRSPNAYAGGSPNVGCSPFFLRAGGAEISSANFQGHEAILGRLPIAVKGTGAVSPLTEFEESLGGKVGRVVIGRVFQASFVTFADPL